MWACLRFWSCSNGDLGSAGGRKTPDCGGWGLSPFLSIPSAIHFVYLFFNFLLLLRESHADYYKEFPSVLDADKEI